MEQNNNLELTVKLQKKKNALRCELKEMGSLINGEKNTYDNYQYFSEAQYKELFTKLFSKYGLELKVDEIDYKPFAGTEKQPFGRLVTLCFSLIDIDTGYAESTSHTGEGLDRSDKAGYKATTGAIKKYLSSTFLVATKDDPEIEDEKAKTKQAKKSNVKSSSALITPAQKKLLIELFNDDVTTLKEELKSLKKVKLDELTVNEASILIKKRKGN